MGLSKSITSLKEIKLTVITMLKYRFFLYIVAHPYIAVQTCRLLAPTHLKRVLFIEISVDET
jgi:hypothetical protein